MKLQLLCGIILIILELPLSVKAWKAYQNVDITRFVAIALLMFLTALSVYGIYYLMTNLLFL